MTSRVAVTQIQLIEAYDKANLASVPCNVLTVSGERKEEREDKGKTYHRVERRSGSFSRSFRLPCPVEEDEVAAAYQEGVLTITMPKTEEAKTRKITVKG